MNIKKVLSKSIACSVLAASISTVGLPTQSANASMTPETNWKTLVLICPRTEIEATPYNSHQTTIMNDSEVERVKNDAKIMESTVNEDSIGNINMNVDVVVSQMPITNKTLSKANGSYIDSCNVEKILDKYAPEGKYDSVLVVYRSNDYTTSLGTTNITQCPKTCVSTNGSIYSTVKLDDKDHSMDFLDNNTPMYLIDRLADGLYTYFKNEGFTLDAPDFTPYTGGDKYQYNKFKRTWYRYYFAGMNWDANSKGGITKDMWTTTPTNK